MFKKLLIVLALLFGVAMCTAIVGTQEDPATETNGEVVYYFDPETVRGNTTFPFRAVRIKNPTDSTLESGPVTVFGEGRFIGEGLAEPGRIEPSRRQVAPLL